MIVRKALFVMALSAVVFLSGCAGTFSSMMTAKPTEGMGLAFEGIVLMAGTNIISSATTNGPSFIPNPNVWYRGMPVKDFLEIGGRISLLSAALDVKVIPLNTDIFSLAGDVELSYQYYYYAASGFTADLAASVLVTIQPIEFISFTLAPKFKWAMFSLPMYGGSFVLSLFNSPSFALLFDVSYITYIPGTFQSSTTNSFSTALNNTLNSLGFLSFGIGLQF